jgi:hypothetical protein
VIQEDYRSGALLLCGDVNGKPPVVIKQHLKHYIVGKKFVENVEEFHYISHREGY